ncbi:hypothetical protein JCM10207_005432 [Rhodosporidiobolus poonsookiae]
MDYGHVGGHYLGAGSRWDLPDTALNPEGATFSSADPTHASYAPPPPLPPLSIHSADGAEVYGRQAAWRPSPVAHPTYDLADHSHPGSPYDSTPGYGPSPVYRPLVRRAPKRFHPDYDSHALGTSPNPNTAGFSSPYPRQPVSVPPQERVEHRVHPPVAADFAPQVGFVADNYPYPPNGAHMLVYVKSSRFVRRPRFPPAPFSLPQPEQKSASNSINIDSIRAFVTGVEGGPLEMPSPLGEDFWASLSYAPLTTLPDPPTALTGLSSTASIPSSASSPPSSTSAQTSATAAAADDAALLPVLVEAAQRREAHAARPPPITWRPARDVTGGGAPAPAGGSNTRFCPVPGSAATAPPAEAASVPQETSEQALAREMRRQRREEAAQFDRGRANCGSSGSVISLEVPVRCGCGGCALRSASGTGMPLARAVLRSLSSAMLDFLEGTEGQLSPALAVEVESARGWACLEGDAQLAARRDGRSAAAGDEAGRKADSHGKYEDTLSAAIDRLKGLGLDGKGQARDGTPTTSGGLADEQQKLSMADDEDEWEDWKALELMKEHEVAQKWWSKILKCDVCGDICGIGSLSPSRFILPEPPSHPAFPSPEPFTVEIICARCDALFKSCSDCGGGGGRLTPGRWRCRELFPNGRKTCKLSHTRNPALGDVSCEVFPLFPSPPANLNSLFARCRAIYFNARLGAIARPEFLLTGDGLASTYTQAERVTIDHWVQMEEKLLQKEPLICACFPRQQPAEEEGIRRYVTALYSKPRRRHPKRDNKPDNSARSQTGKAKSKDNGANSGQVLFGFGIIESDFNLGTLYFCMALPWFSNGHAFDSISLLGESTTARVKADIAAANLRRAEAGLPLYPPLKYNYTISPFAKDSRGNLTLIRRGYELLADLVKKDPSCQAEWFPPIKESWLPRKYAAALSTWVRVLHGDEDLGGPPPGNAPRKRPRRSPKNVEQAPAPSHQHHAHPIHTLPAHNPHLAHLPRLAPALPLPLPSATTPGSVSSTPYSPFDEASQRSSYF